MSNITIEDITRIHQEMSLIHENGKDTSDEFFIKLEALNKTFKCNHCNAEFGIFDIETNEMRNKYWCLECDELIFEIT